MKLNISYPFTGQEKLIEINDDQKLMPFMDKHIGAEVEGSSLGDEYKGYLFRISGGNDKQGFPMKQGILTSNRVRVLLTKGQKCYRPRRTGERKRKSVRGCITSNELCVLDLVIVKKGPKELAGLTDKTQPRRLGPKRAGKIRKLFSLTKDDDVRKFVVRRTVKKDRSKAPKIQRLVTEVRRARKRYLERQKVRKAIKTRTQLAQYKALIAAQRRKERKERLEKANKKAKKTTKKGTKKEEEEKKEVKEEKKTVTKKEAPKKDAKVEKKAAPAKADKKAAPAPKKDAKVEKKAPAAKTDKKAAAPKKDTKVEKKAPAAKTDKKAPAKTEKKAAAPKKDTKVEKKAPAPKTEKKAAAPKTEKKAVPKAEKKAPAAKAAPAPAKGKKPAKKN